MKAIENVITVVTQAKERERLIFAFHEENPKIRSAWKNIMNLDFYFKSGPFSCTDVQCTSGVGSQRLVNDTIFYEVLVSMADLQYMAKSQASG